MARILGIETSCDETAAAVYDSRKQKILSSTLFSQTDLHALYGGVVPEIASRSHVEKIDLVTKNALSQAGITLDDLDAIAVTQKPGLAGSLLVGLCFAKGIAWAKQKPLIGVDHLEGHVFSAFLGEDDSVRGTWRFPYLALSVSGGHTSIYIVQDFGKFELLGQTIDDAAGEAFDKTAALMGLGYPGGPRIEQLAKKASNKDFFAYPRGKKLRRKLDVSFSGLKTAVLYDLVKKGAFVLGEGLVPEKLTDELKAQVASSLQWAIADIFADRLSIALKDHPNVHGVALVGGVSANKFIVGQLREACSAYEKPLVSPPLRFCGDNGAMIAFVGNYMLIQGKTADLTLDIAPH